MSDENTDLPFDRTDIITCDPRVAEGLSGEEIELLDALASGYETAKIAVFGDEPLHFGYWDKSLTNVNSSALMRIQEEGYAVMRAGTRHLDPDSPEHGYVEAKPREFYEENFWD